MPRSTEAHVVSHAADSYVAKKIDFVDSLLLAHHQLHGDHIATFDRKLNACIRNS